MSLPAGTFDTQFTFAQALSEAAKAAKQTVLVVSIPESKNEIGGSFGQAALEQLKNAIGRVESPWHPARPDESFEIVRRRLFQPMTGDQFIARDAVAKAFSELYGSQHQEFPPDCREAGYERRIKMAYPIHPELFDRLHNDWSALDKFQRTRGVLRLMAAVIHSLWDRQDGNLLIMPATIPIDDPKVQDELTRYLEDQWMPIIEKDVDGPNSLPLAVDRETPTLGRYSACRRVARTIYMGSAPTQKAANRGIDDRQVKLGCVQPGEAVATFGDALRRLTDRATYLYVDGKRYWYSTQPTVTRLADDRASQRTEDDINEEISRRLRGQAGKRDAFSKVHACCPGSDIPDERTARLVILGPEFPHTAKNAGSAARKEALAILESRGNSPRTYRNTLVMLAADSNRLRELQSAVRQFLAWDSIWDDRETLNLDPFQTKQAETKLRTSDETVDVRIPETFQWLLVPGQSDPKGDIEWTEIRLQGQDSLATRAAKKLRNEELLMTELRRRSASARVGPRAALARQSRGREAIGRGHGQVSLPAPAARRRRIVGRDPRGRSTSTHSLGDVCLCRTLGRPAQALRRPGRRPPDSCAVRGREPGGQAGGGRRPVGGRAGAAARAGLRPARTATEGRHQA